MARRPDVLSDSLSLFCRPPASRKYHGLARRITPGSSSVLDLAFLAAPSLLQLPDHPTAAPLRIFPCDPEPPAPKCLVGNSDDGDGLDITRWFAGAPRGRSHLAGGGRDESGCGDDFDL